MQNPIKGEKIRRRYKFRLYSLWLQINKEHLYSSVCITNRPSTATEQNDNLMQCNCNTKVAVNTERYAVEATKFALELWLNWLLKSKLAKKQTYE